MNSADTSRTAPVGEGAPRAPRRSYAARVVAETFARHGARIGLAWISILVIFAVFAPFIASSFPIAIRTAEGGWSSPLLAHLGPADVILLGVFFTIVLLLCMRSLPAGLRRWAGLIIAVTLALVCAYPSLIQWMQEPKSGDVRPAIAWLGAAPQWHVLAAGIALVGFASLLALLWRRRVLARPAGLVLIVWMLLWVAPWTVWRIDPPRAIEYDRWRELEHAGKLEAVLRTPIPYSPTDRLRDRGDTTMLAPSTDHWLGTESNGADVASRMIHAARIALAIGFIATGIAIVIGVTLGGLMGYYGGVVDLIGMRLLEIIEAIPTLFLLLMFVAFFDRNLYFIMVIIGLTGWSGYARFIRAEFLKLRRQDFVQAAVACGLPLRSILFRHMLPNGIAPVLVSASFGVASAILYEATLSFLGLGLVDEPSWGELLNQAIGASGSFSWWLATFPGGAIFLTVFAYTLIGEALRDAIDPHLKKSAHL